MIFVTVGTHEQSFERLVSKIDELKSKSVIAEDVIIQKGFTKYDPKHCTSYNWLEYSDVEKYMKEARIIITHGGPASFIATLSLNKTPIVVPRMRKYDEHVNDHQMEFAKQVVKRDNSIIVCEDIENLEELIRRYDDIVITLKEKYCSNNRKFCEKLELEMKKMFDK